MAETQIEIPRYVKVKGDPEIKTIKICDFCGLPQKQVVPNSSDIPTPRKLLPDNLTIKTNCIEICFSCNKDVCKNCIAIDNYTDVGHVVICKMCHEKLSKNTLEALELILKLEQLKKELEVTEDTLDILLHKN
jgi:hypothetical protein